MTMDDIYHSAKCYLRGTLAVDDAVSTIRAAWAIESIGNRDSPIHRLGLNRYQFPADVDTKELLGGEWDFALWITTASPRDADSRSCWGPAIGHLIDFLLESADVEAGVLISDEGHGVGYWTRERAVVNSTVGREGYSMREPLALMLIDRFEAAGIAFEFEDLGFFLSGWPDPGD